MAEPQGGHVNPAPGALSYRVETLEGLRKQDREDLDKAEKLAAKHEIEIHGERGINATLRSMDSRLMWTNRILGTLAVALISGCILLVLQLASGAG